MSNIDSSDKGFEPMYFDVLAASEENSFWFRSRNRLILWALKKYYSGAKDFLEVGCGSGFVLSGISNQMPNMELSGCDFFEEGLEFASKRVPSARLLQADARMLPFDNEFDVVGSFDVLEHIVEDEVVLSNMYRALKPNGCILLAVPQHQFLYNQYDKRCCHKRRYGRKELVDKVRRAGFNVQCVTSFVFILFPFMIASRVMEKMNLSKASATSALRLPRIVDVVFEWVMRFECTLIKCGIRFPFGGSLLLVGHKNS